MNLLPLLLMQDEQDKNETPKNFIKGYWSIYTGKLSPVNPDSLVRNKGYSLYKKLVFVVTDSSPEIKQKLGAAWREFSWSYNGKMLLGEPKVFQALLTLAATGVEIITTPFGEE